MREEMGKDPFPWKMHLFLLVLMSLICFARFFQGFGVAVERFRVKAEREDDA
jgi:hypothetical protein